MISLRVILMYDLTVIYQYLYNKQVWAGNDVIQLINNVSFREADPIDHLEMVMAQTRKAAIEEMSLELFRLMRTIGGGGKQ